MDEDRHTPSSDRLSVSCELPLACFAYLWTGWKCVLEIDEWKLDQASWPGVHTWLLAFSWLGDLPPSFPEVAQLPEATPHTRRTSLFEFILGGLGCLVLQPLWCHFMSSHCSSDRREETMLSGVKKDKKKHTSEIVREEEKSYLWIFKKRKFRKRTMLSV